MAGSARLGTGAALRRLERLVAVAVPSARDRTAAGAGDAHDHRGGDLPLSRNPLYVGLLGLYLGLALLAPTFWGLVLFPAAVLLVLWGAIRPEERFLHERFGAPYDDYTRRVRRWL